MARQTFAQMQGDHPTLYVDGTAVEDDDARESLTDAEGARVQVEWDGVTNGYVSDGWRCTDCGETFERWRDAQKHGRDDHGARPANVEHVDPLANSAAIDWMGDDLTVTISTGDPRGAFVMTLRRLDDGTRLLHVPHPSNGLLHEELTELHPGTYKIGGERAPWVDPRETLRQISALAYATDEEGYPLQGHVRLADVQIALDAAGYGKAE